MAEALIVSITAKSLVSIILQNLAPLAGEELRLFSCVSKDLEKLSKTFETIQDVLADAENRQAKESTVKRWLAKLKDVAYDADDILDECKTKALRSEIDKSIHPTRNRLQVCNFFSPCFCFNQIAFRCKMGHRIKDIRERLEGISQEMSQFNFVRQGVVSVRTVESVQVMKERQTTSLVDKLGVFGRDDNKKWLIDLLLNESSNQEEKLSIISIYGMGGLGKTTLAQLAYDDESVKDHFEIRMWVCVSTDFRPIRLMSAMIQSATKETCNFTELEPFQDHLRQILNGKRFLLVLDDVWDEDGEQWNKLRVPLTFCAKGSRIVVTTRKKKVAEIIGATPTHILDLPHLSDEHCWLLFSHKAFNGRSKEECLEFEDIGREIVKKCRRLPLAVNTIGSVMHFKKTKQEWEEIRESEIWTNVGNDILPALMLSYQDLPAHLKQCFSYLAIFPKDYEIEKEKLIYMWMAQGYVLPEKGKDMEELGGSYFDDLVWRSLLQDYKIHYFLGETTSITCKMHDLISDLAQSISRKECSIIDSADMPIEAPIKSRHSSFISTGNAESLPEAFCNNANHLRTIMFIKEPKILKVPRDLLHYSRRLRVLDLSGSDLQEVPYSIENLKHLRYLDLSETKIEKLPDSMSRMCNLMFLNLEDCNNLQKLPDKMGEMISLRYLHIRSYRLNYFPNGIGRIKSLRTLKTFGVGEGDHQFKIGEIKNLNLLHTLFIYQLERVANGDDAKEAALKEKKKLDDLKLCWNEVNVLEESEMERQVDVLEGLQPNTNLRRLEIRGYNGHNFPSWIGDQSFSNLTNVCFDKCKNCQILPPLGQLPSLKYLWSWGMDNVKYVGREFYGSGWVKGFPKLETLIIWWFEKLEEWDLRVEEGEMPSLLNLRILNCCELKSLPHLPSNLKRLYIEGCPLLKERCQEGGEDWNKIAHVQQKDISEY